MPKRRSRKTSNGTPVRAFRIPEEMADRIEAFRAEEQAKHPEILQYTQSMAVRVLLDRALSEAGHPAAGSET